MIDLDHEQGSAEMQHPAIHYTETQGPNNTGRDLVIQLNIIAYILDL